MIRHRTLPIVLIAVAVALAMRSTGPVLAQQVVPVEPGLAPPIHGQPVNLAASEPLAPMQVRAEDAQRLLEALGVPITAAAPTTVSPTTTATRTSGGISRKIKVKAPPVVNNSAQFIFRDVTQRDGAASPKLSLEQRQAAVEAYRQSLARKKEAGR